MQYRGIWYEISDTEASNYFVGCKENKSLWTVSTKNVPAESLIVRADAKPNIVSTFLSGDHPLPLDHTRMIHNTALCKYTR